MNIHRIFHSKEIMNIHRKFDTKQLIYLNMTILSIFTCTAWIHVAIL